MSDFSKNLDALLKKRGMTYKELASKTKIPYPTLHRYATDSGSIKVKYLKRLVNFFQCSTDELLFGEKSFPEKLRNTTLDFKLNQIQAIIDS